ncbi:MAG: P-loop NTPase [Treponemataceae bacterium]|nr:MAG: P-loop NTPase [Treponemataceae bacterium]
MQIIPVASGKGGVGKSLVSANLAIALGQAGKQVVLADLDLGASNLHLVIGQHSPKAGIGPYLAGHCQFDDILTATEYEGVTFIAGDAEIPGLTALKIGQKNELIRRLQGIDADYLIIDLGAGTHLSILDIFLISPQGIVVATPTVTATLNGYLFLKNVLFRLMYNTFKKTSRAYAYLEKLRSDAKSLQRLYFPKLIEVIEGVDGESVEFLKNRMAQFYPRLILNQVDDPKDIDKALKIRRSCQEYLGIDLEYLGVVFTDNLQDKALASRLPVIVYKPGSLIAQSIYRIAEKILDSETREFGESAAADENENYRQIEEEAEEVYLSKMSYLEDLVGSGTLTMGELAEAFKSQQYEITQLRKENLLLKSKILQAREQGFKV